MSNKVNTKFTKFTSDKRTVPLAQLLRNRAKIREQQAQRVQPKQVPAAGDVPRPWQWSKF